MAGLTTIIKAMSPRGFAVGAGETGFSGLGLASSGFFHLNLTPQLGQRSGCPSIRVPHFGHLNFIVKILVVCKSFKNHNPPPTKNAISFDSIEQF
ncbi:MAG: hypothetical protein PUE65_07055 [Mollicutes bacterium]|nr:hypothetical protein [Mollicutes bacterium]